jgi:hypothetical protein
MLELLSAHVFVGLRESNLVDQPIGSAVFRYKLRTLRVGHLPVN